ncbi:sensor histidine kinase [Pantoea sp. 1.19]|uniref:sensor histidine kinase n=1 Tax=Pantoea sp. 1.19 TaxID=1925589 RepID=UPI0009490E57|nr:sensor histidine kinase [Pantoea sp. 1.19]
MTRSLRGQLLLWLGLPLLLLWALSVWTHYQSALAAATQAYDRSLLASARTVAERLRVREHRLEVDVPWVVLDTFERNMNDQLFYQVISPDGHTLSGFDDLPPIPITSQMSPHYPALVHFYDARYRRQPIRIAALWQPVNEGGVEGMALILVAETLNSRREFARNLLMTALFSQSALVLITLLLVALLIRRLLRPLRHLSAILMRRDPGDLRPLPAVIPWSEMQPLMLAFNHFQARLRQMVDRQARFSADASHQLRTPLTILNTQVGMALKSHDPQQWRESLLGMRATLSDTITLTDRLLQLSRLRAHQQAALSRQPLELVAVVQEACMLSLNQARSRQIDLGYEGDERCRVAGDALLLSELCANLLDNALKYTPADGMVTASVRNGVLSIEDSGPGIEPALHQQAMEPFGRLPQETPVAGSGLGLALVKDITEWHGTQARLDRSPTLGGLRVLIRFTPLPDPPADDGEERTGGAGAERAARPPA